METCGRDFFQLLYTSKSNIKEINMVPEKLQGNQTLFTK